MNELLFDPETHRKAGRLLGELLANYEIDLSNQSVFPQINRDAMQAILTEPFPEEGKTLEELFQEFREVVVPNSTHVAHPRFLPYVLPSSNGISAFAEALASTLNQNCNLWTLSPAANAIEQRVISWFHELFSFPKGSGGIITSGGSMANLTALAAARDTYLGNSARTEGIQGRTSPLRLYVSEQVHNSVDKAAVILGLGLNHVCHIPCDPQFRIRMDLLKEAVLRDRREGFSPFCVVGSAGTVTTGAIDPLDALANFCGEEHLWLHIDGAYGALAILSERMRAQLLPAGRAHSLSLDPHKFLFTSLEAGCVLVRRAEDMRSTYSFIPSYLSMVSDTDFLNYAEYGPQLSRSFKALKVWWSLRAYGRKTYAKAIDNLCDLAAYMGERSQAEPELELMAPVTLNAVCVRCRNLTDSQNERVLARLLSEGIAFLGRAEVKGKFCLRACFMNLRTTGEDVDRILDEMIRFGQEELRN
ncbi:pyridoxal-dependent decarboxylase [Candidatus Vecturithrix granuli]|uniref:Pyridoxal-dependent decarboxylase n=1 Tax=Vecturithrix granuli TaxID=1499967 RepID=A0A081C160_VECG1|nr:pyridoxal-dependent decarboxylase [Candidatus Vecturithrix granuli]